MRFQINVLVFVTGGFKETIHFLTHPIYPSLSDYIFEPIVIDTLTDALVDQTIHVNQKMENCFVVFVVIAFAVATTRTM